MTRLSRSGFVAAAPGHRDLAWWGTVGFVVLEGLTLLVCAVTYFYFRYRSAWSPAPTPLPALGPALLQAGLMALSWYPVSRLARAAHRFDRDRVQRAGLVVLAFGLAFVVVRWFELRALDVGLGGTAYGSIAWTTLGLHTTLLLLEVAGALCCAVPFFGSRPTDERYADVSDHALYWYFMTGSWIVLAGMIYLLPRIGSTLR
jgi:heme/copper-type cytochrome/quinol oxidase subunit 3